MLVLSVRMPDWEEGVPTLSGHVAGGPPPLSPALGIWGVWMCFLDCTVHRLGWQATRIYP